MYFKLTHTIFYIYILWLNNTIIIQKTNTHRISQFDKGVKKI